MLFRWHSSIRSTSLTNTSCFFPHHFTSWSMQRLCSAIIPSAAAFRLSSSAPTTFVRPCLHVHDSLLWISNKKKLLEHTGLFLLISDMPQYLANPSLPRPTVNKTANTKLVHKLVLSALHRPLRSILVRVP